MNKVSLIGRITKDLELRRTNTNLAYCKFTLAVNRMFSKNNEADFINCVAWKKTAENLVKYMGKGSRIGVVGAIQTGSYQNQNGQKVYTTEVNVSEVEFLDTKAETQNNNNYQENVYQETGFEKQTTQDNITPNDFGSDGDLPF